jgi:type II secretory pathway component PulL
LTAPVFHTKHQWVFRRLAALLFCLFLAKELEKYPPAFRVIAAE